MYSIEMDSLEIAARLRGSYRSLHGVVVVSPRLLEEAAEAIEALEAQQIASALYLARQSKTEHGKPEKLRIYINRKLAAVMSPNKRAAHAVHAALEAFGVHPGIKVIVLDKGPTEIAKMRISIRDAGHTELEPGTLTSGTNYPEDSQP